jgi:hypothetical protein
MKNTFFTAILFITFSGLMAQNSQTDSISKKYIGVNFNGAYSAADITSTDNKQILINSTPFYGYRIKNFVIGAGIGYNYQHNKYPAIYSTSGPLIFATNNYHEISVFPIVRFYSKFGLFLSSSFSFGIGKGNTKYPTSISRTITYASFDSESKLWSANFGLGYAIKAGKSFLIEPQISYNYMNKTTTNNLNNTIQYSLFPSNTNTTNSNIFLGFGITYRF